jgi:Metallopeptidase family M24
VSHPFRAGGSPTSPRTAATAAPTSPRMERARGRNAAPAGSNRTPRDVRSNSGARLGDVGAAVEELALREGCSVVRELGGHGIGRVMHAPPHVAHHGRRGTGARLRAGMVITIEPMINLGGAAVRFLDDGWTVVTADGSLSAQFEHTVLVTLDGCEVLTALHPAPSNAVITLSGSPA